MNLFDQVYSIIELTVKAPVTKGDHTIGSIEDMILRLACLILRYCLS